MYVRTTGDGKLAPLLRGLLTFLPPLNIEESKQVGQVPLRRERPHLLFGGALLTLIEKVLGDSWGEKRVSEMFGVVGEEKKLGMLT